MRKKIFGQKIIEWYHEHKRFLPWRETTDPYKIWLSEIILQQTRVVQGLPYYLKFIEHFPDVVVLARADEEEVLRFWQGLGYYSRARNLHRCAKVIVNQFAGRFPDNFHDLKALPGIGPYTAAAIASICFLEPVAVVDGNVYRVLARVFGIAHDITTPAGKEHFLAAANKLISREHPDEFNQAIMEFGALHCLPQNPKCDDCIFQKKCVAFAGDMQSQLPVKGKKRKPRNRYFYYFVFQQNKRLAMRKREGKDIWKGLYDFYLVEARRPQRPGIIVARSEVVKTFGDKIKIGTPSAVYQHVLTHQILHARFFPAEIESKKPTRMNLAKTTLRFYKVKEINALPKPTLVSRYLSDFDFL